MAEGRAIRNKQYTPNLLSHDVQQQPKDIFRQSNTFSSQAFSYEPVVPDTYNHQRIFQERPLAPQVTRASYQDSNPLNQKDRTTAETIQRTEPDKIKNVRATPTYITTKGADLQHDLRSSNTFKSTAFMQS
jgi:hypothetical protein